MRVTVQQQGYSPPQEYDDPNRVVIQGTVVLPGQARQELALPDGMSGAVGLEGLTIDEIPTPRLNILHQDALFEDSLTGAKFPEFHAIILGFNRERAYFPSEFVGDGNDIPVCKSPNASDGLPNVDAAHRNAFPWDKSPFDPNSVPIAPNGRVMLPCGNCSFKDWRGDDARTPPLCSDVWNLIVMFDPYGTGQAVPAFLALKKSGLRPARAHFARYMQAQIPAFTDVVKVSLDQKSRGKNLYCVPSFEVVGTSDPSMYPVFVENLKNLQRFASDIRPARDIRDTGVQQAAFDPNEIQQQPVQQPMQQQQYVQQPQHTAQQPSIPQQQQYAPQPVAQVQQPQYVQPAAPVVEAPAPQQYVAPAVPTASQPPASAVPAPPVVQQATPVAPPPPVVPAPPLPPTVAQVPAPQVIAPSSVIPQVASQPAAPIPPQAPASPGPAWAGAAAPVPEAASGDDDGDDGDLPF